LTVLTIDDLPDDRCDAALALSKLARANGSTHRFRADDAIARQAAFDLQHAACGIVVYPRRGELMLILRPMHPDQECR
jgi:hypothetical protein